MLEKYLSYEPVDHHCLSNFHTPKNGALTMGLIGLGSLTITNLMLVAAPQMLSISAARDYATIPESIKMEAAGLALVGGAVVSGIVVGYLDQKVIAPGLDYTQKALLRGIDYIAQRCSK